MLENVIAVEARIAEIRARFGVSRADGQVSVTPHQTSMPGLKSQQTQPFFPSYLLKQARAANSVTTQSPTAYDDIIERTSAKYGVESALVKAVIQAESGFNPNAVSHAGAQGLMQLMPSTAAGLGVSDSFDPAQNIDAGVQYLKKQIDRFGGVEQALGAYNAGPGAVIKHGGVPPYRETQNYVSKVLSYRDSYRR